MASIARDKKTGRRSVEYINADGERKRIRLGKVSKKHAEQVARHVEELSAAHTTGAAVDRRTAEWLRDLPDRMYDKLVRQGLVEPRHSAAAVTLGELVDRFERACSVKSGTMAAYRQGMKSLLEYFGAERAIDTITDEDAHAWRKSIDASGIAKATTAKRTRTAKSIFRRAVRWKLLAASPFEELRTGSQVNEDRLVYVERETIETVLACCPDSEWKAVFALARFAGLRCPSEVGALRWQDVKWERNRLLVRSPKTEGHEGRGSRVTPIAPELKAILLARVEDEAEGDAHVVPRLTDSSINLRTQAQRIIERAGVETWPRLFQALRSSCSMDWIESVPNHAVAKWLGHTPKVQAAHYLRVRDVHFDQVTGGEQGGAKCGAQAAQKAAQQGTATSRTDLQHRTESPENTAFMQPGAETCESVQGDQVGWVGFEPTANRL